MGEELWERHYGADPAIVGREILVDDDAMVVVGIVPRDTRMLVHPEGERERIDVWVARAPLTSGATSSIVARSCSWPKE